jgi:hypothetical protein
MSGYAPVIPGLTLFVIPGLTFFVIPSAAPLSLRAQQSNLIPTNMSLLRRTSSQ